MSDPNAPVQWVGETAAHFKLRQQQYFIPATGPAQDMARQWMNLCTGPFAPKSFTIK